MAEVITFEQGFIVCAESWTDVRRLLQRKEKFCFVMKTSGKLKTGQ
jgi:hypothetical protein